jgi:hypothetical protein
MLPPSLQKGVVDFHKQAIRQRIEAGNCEIDELAEASYSEKGVEDGETDGYFSLV